MIRGETGRMFSVTSDATCAAGETEEKCAARVKSSGVECGSDSG